MDSTHRGTRESPPPPAETKPDGQIPDLTALSKHLDSKSQTLEAPTPYNPYWDFSSTRPRAQTNLSYHSLNFAPPTPIRLEDHSDSTSHTLAGNCWARSATIDDYVLVSGSTGLGAYVVWHCTVSTLKGGNLVIRKRYSEFSGLREGLLRAFPGAGGVLPVLPRKSVVSRFRPEFLEVRREGLQHFLK